MTKFNLSIDLFTEDMADAADVAAALRSVADRLTNFTSQPWSPYALSGTIYTRYGNVKRPVGAWSVDSDTEAGLTITAENDPDSRLHCVRCGEHVPGGRVCPLCEHDHGQPADEHDGVLP